MIRNLRDIHALSRFIILRFVHDRCAQTAASLTFTTLLSLVPIMTIALAMFSVFPVFEDVSLQFKSYLLKNLMPETAGAVITGYMQQFAESATKLTTVGIGVLAVTALTTMFTIEHAFNVIWRVRQKRSLVRRLVIYWAVLTLAPLLVGVSLSLTSWLVGLSMGYAKHVPLFGVGALKTLPVLLTTAAFALLFRLLPNRYVPRGHALIGAVIAAILFEIMNRVFGYYIAHFNTYKLVYGAFASVPIFLLWIYLSWMTILFGAVISASLSHWRTPATHYELATSQLVDALRVLKLMLAGFDQGKVLTFPEMSKTLRIGYDRLEFILEKLAGADMVRKAEGHGWLMMRDAVHIRTSELLRLFVMDSRTILAGQGDDPIGKWLSARTRQFEKDIDKSLLELFAAPSAGHGGKL
jgi:membrane protein